MGVAVNREGCSRFAMKVSCATGWVESGGDKERWREMEKGEMGENPKSGLRWERNTREEDSEDRNRIGRSKVEGSLPPASDDRLKHAKAKAEDLPTGCRQTSSTCSSSVTECLRLKELDDLSG